MRVLFYYYRIIFRLTGNRESSELLITLNLLADETNNLAFHHKEHNIMIMIIIVRIRLLDCYSIFVDGVDSGACFSLCHRNYYY